MNLVFLALLDNFVSFFRDGVFSNIDTSEFAGKNVRDLLKSYFEEEKEMFEQFQSDMVIAKKMEFIVKEIDYLESQPWFKN